MKQPMDKQLSQAFTSLRFWLALLVVYIHIDNNCPLSFTEVSKFGGGVFGLRPTITLTS